MTLQQESQQQHLQQQQRQSERKGNEELDEEELRELLDDQPSPPRLREFPSDEIVENTVSIYIAIVAMS